MMDLSDLAKMLERSADRAKVELEFDLAKIGGHAQVLAAEYIGHELPEWPRLAASTIAEKTRLGYVGHVSATDPLLRTGDNQQSIEVELEGLDVAVGSHRKEFLFMEAGTSRAPPRPALAPAMLRTLPYAGDLLSETAVRLLTPGVK